MPKPCSGKKKASSTNGAGKPDVHMQKGGMRLTSMALCRNDVQTDRRPKQETPKLSEENIGGSLQDAAVGEDFLRKAPPTQSRANTGQAERTKLNSFCTATKAANCVKRKLREWRSLPAVLLTEG